MEQKQKTLNVQRLKTWLIRLEAQWIFCNNHDNWRLQSLTGQDELKMCWGWPKVFGSFHGGSGSTISTLLHDKINPKDCQVASPLVIQGFSNFLGLFQVTMANPEGECKLENMLCMNYISDGVPHISSSEHEKIPAWHVSSREINSQSVKVTALFVDILSRRSQVSFCQSCFCYKSVENSNWNAVFFGEADQEVWRFFLFLVSNISFHLTCSTGPFLTSCSNFAHDVQNLPTSPLSRRGLVVITFWPGLPGFPLRVAFNWMGQYQGNPSCPPLE